MLEEKYQEIITAKNVLRVATVVVNKIYLFIFLLRKNPLIRHRLAYFAYFIYFFLNLVCFSF